MTNKSYSAAVPVEIHDVLSAHLKREDKQEDLCFAVWYPSQGATRLSALIAYPVLPKEGERRVHGNASFLPQYFDRALGEAMKRGGGLAFLHSHPGGGWQGMSDDDVDAERWHAAATQGATGLPLVGLTMGADDGAWSARFWVKIAPRTYERRWCESVRVVGRKLSVTWHPELRPRPSFRPSLERTISAWGPNVQADFARLRIGVVGAGSVGSMVAEALARTGNGHVDLFDFDAIELRNLDRLLHANEDDVGKAKVHVLAEGLRRSATTAKAEVRPFEWSVVEEEGLAAALDCDVLFSCVDRPWPRSAMNYVAFAHLIPVVDGGVQVSVTRAGTLKRADWRAHIAAPTRRCLECIGQYNPGDVSLERDGLYDDPVYIEGLPKDHFVRANENVFAFSMNVASFEVLQLLTMMIAPSGVSSPGAQMYHFVPGFMEEPDTRGCNENCIYPTLTARGDCGGLTVTAKHARAEDARRTRQAVANQPSPNNRVSLWTRLLRWFGK